MPPTLLSAIALALAVAATFWFDRQLVRRRLMPPRFDQPLRRTLAATLVAGILFLGVFLPLVMVGESDPGELVDRPPIELFTVHFLLLITVTGWYGLGFLLPTRTEEGFAAQFGLKTRQPGTELWLGLAAGGAGWLGMIAVMLLVVGVVSLLGGQDSLPQRPPEVIAWLAGLPWPLRLALALSAGFFEELFFRGFLQPRMGILASTVVFVLAHASYEQPFMLVGLTFLSLLFGWLVSWRQSIWPAVVAHAAFDAFQLLVVIPLALKVVPAAS